MIRVFLLVCIAAACARAQRFEIGAFGGFHHIPQKDLGSASTEDREDSDTRLTGKTAVGGRFTLNSPGYYGHELSYFQTRGTLNTTVRKTVNRETVATTYSDTIKIQTASYNFLIYFMPSGEKWRPFMTGGITMRQYEEPSFPADIWTRPRSRHYGANYGFGLKLIPHKNFLMRLDWRHYLTGKPYDLEFSNFQSTGGLLATMEATIGVSIAF